MQNEVIWHKFIFPEARKRSESHKIPKKKLWWQKRNCVLMIFFLLLFSCDNNTYFCLLYFFIMCLLCVKMHKFVGTLQNKFNGIFFSFYVFWFGNVLLILCWIIMVFLGNINMETNYLFEIIFWYENSLAE